MKKLFICLILGFSLPCMATEVTTMRVFKELNDTCKSAITTNNYRTDVMACSMQFVQNPLNWRPGWSTPTKCNMSAVFVGKGQDTVPYLSPDQERMLQPILQGQMYTAFSTAMQKFQAAGLDKVKLTPQEVEAWLK